MAKQRQTKQPTDEGLVGAVGNSGQSVNDFFEEHKQTITYLLGGLFVVVIGFLIYRQFVQIPRAKEAAEQIAQAQMQFERDSFALALTNPGQGYPGFVDIAEDYSGTETGNLALYYAGISYLNLGQYEAAIDYLEDYNPSGSILPTMKAGALGDAYSEMNDFDKALSLYKKAAKSDNDYLASYYLKKYGMLSERQGNTGDAQKAYQRIKTEYFDTPAAGDIDKYLARVGG
ncbi:MAG: hypothetical protein D6772_03320 [Bacteroidetes bacterium]|nr:MAG: hypothetical protein D6772_03320 [Bacteroidota bacterium]